VVIYCIKKEASVVFNSGPSSFSRSLPEQTGLEGLNAALDQDFNLLRISSNNLSFSASPFKGSCRAVTEGGFKHQGAST